MREIGRVVGDFRYAWRMARAVWKQRIPGTGLRCLWLWFYFVPATTLLAGRIRRTNLRVARMHTRNG